MLSSIQQLLNVCTNKLHTKQNRVSRILNARIEPILNILVVNRTENDSTRFSHSHSSLSKGHENKTSAHSMITLQLVTLLAENACYVIATTLHNFLHPILSNTLIGRLTRPAVYLSRIRVILTSQRQFPLRLIHFSLNAQCVHCQHSTYKVKKVVMPMILLSQYSKSQQTQPSQMI